MSYQDLLRQLRAKDPDFGKVRNDNPAEEFAFNIHGTPSIAEVSRLSREQAIRELLASDDFGSPVVEVPLAATSGKVFMDFCPQSLVLEPGRDALPLGAFLWEIADAIAREMCPNAAEFEFVCPPEEILASRFDRFYYSHSPNSDRWYMTFAE